VVFVPSALALAISPLVSIVRQRRALAGDEVEPEPTASN
jgi:hypothetical protein